MFDIGWSELLVIGVVAIVVVGPKDLPAMLRVVGVWMAKVRRMAADFQAQVNEAMREAELDDAKKALDDLRSANPVNMVRDAMEEAARPVADLGRQLNVDETLPRPAAPATPPPDVTPPSIAPPVTIGPTMPEIISPVVPIAPLPPASPSEEPGAERIRLAAGDRRG